jgi:hypothetical protein
MTNSTNKISTSHWIIGVLALVWNIMGVIAYLTQAYMSEEAMAALPEGDLAYYNNLPAWVTAVFAIAVFAGTFACFGLLMKKKWSIWLFMLSFTAVLAQSVYNFFIQSDIEITGSKSIMPLMVLIIAAFLVWYSRNLESKGILK